MEKLKTLEFYLNDDNDVVVSPITFYFEDCVIWGRYSDKVFESVIGVTWVVMKDSTTVFIEMKYETFDKLMDNFNKSLLKFN